MSHIVTSRRRAARTRQPQGNVAVDLDRYGPYFGTGIVARNYGYLCFDAFGRAKPWAISDPDFWRRGSPSGDSQAWGLRTTTTTHAAITSPTLAAPATMGREAAILYRVHNPGTLNNFFAWGLRDATGPLATSRARANGSEDMQIAWGDGDTTIQSYLTAGILGRKQQTTVFRTTPTGATSASKQSWVDGEDYYANASFFRLRNTGSAPTGPFTWATVGTTSTFHAHAYAATLVWFHLAPPDEDLQRLSAEPYAWLVPMGLRTFFLPAAGGITVSADASVSIAAGADASITQTHVTTAAASASASAGVLATISQTHVIASPNSASVAAGAPAGIGQTHVVLVSASASATVSGSPTLADVITAAANASASTTAGGAPSITQEHLIAIADAVSLATGGAVTLGQAHVIAVPDSVAESISATATIGDGAEPVIVALDGATVRVLADVRVVEVEGDVRLVKVLADRRTVRVLH